MQTYMQTHADTCRHICRHMQTHADTCRHMQTHADTCIDVHLRTHIPDSMHLPVLRYRYSNAIWLPLFLHDTEEKEWYWKTDAFVSLFSETWRPQTSHLTYEKRIVWIFLCPSFSGLKLYLLQAPKMETKWGCRIYQFRVHTLLLLKPQMVWER
jgi:hypothetical protein